MVLRRAHNRAAGLFWTVAALFAQFAICEFGLAAEPTPTDANPLVLPWGHAWPVSCIAFSADGRRIVTGSEDKTAIVWDAVTGRELGTLADPGGGGNASVAISADGRYVATGSSEGAVVVWDTNTRRKRRTLVWHQGKITSLAFLANGNELWTASADQSAALWDIASGLKRQVFNAAAPIVGAAINPDGTRAVTDEADGAVVLWNLANGKRIHTLPGTPAPKPVAVTTPPAADAQPAPEVPPWNPVGAVAFSPDGKQFAAALPDKSVIVCQADTGEKLHTLVGPDAPVDAIAFFAERGQIGAASAQPAGPDSTNDAVVWDARTGKQLRTFELRHANPIGFCSDGARIAVIPDSWSPGARQGFEVRNTRNGETERKFKTNFSRTPAAISRDGKQMAFLTYTGMNEPTGVVAQFSQPVPKFLHLRSWDVSEKSVSFSADGSTLGAAELGGKNFRLWGLKLGLAEERFNAIEQANRYVSSRYDAVFSPDFKTVASQRFLYGSKKGSVRLSDVATGNTIWETSVEGKESASLAFSPDGKQIAVGAAEVFLCDAATGTRIRAFAQTRTADRFAATTVFSPDGKRLDAATTDGRLTLLDVRTGRTLHVFAEASGYIKAILASSPDGTKLATIDNQRKPILVDTATGKRAPITLRGTGSPIRQFWFSPDGALLAAVDESSIHYWDARTGEDRLTLIFLDNVEDWFAMTPAGLFDGSERARQTIGFRIGDGMNTVPAQQVAARFYRPGLFNAILAGERPKPGKGK